MKRKQFQPGQLVRVGRSYWHGIPFGHVCRVVEVCGDGDLLVQGTAELLPSFGGPTQYVDGASCRIAKQATKKVTR